MTSRLMDLVVLLAELSQDPDRSREDLDDELITRGYSPQEIDQAVGWILKKRETLERRERPEEGRRALRVLSEWERLSLGEEAHRFLLKLCNLGLIDQDQLEGILAQVAPYQPERVDLAELKAIASSVVFNLPLGDYDEEALEELEDGGDYN